MNELEFKRHLKDMVHGHHHPEEHDWTPDRTPQTGDAKKAATSKSAGTKRRASRKTPKKK